MENQVSQPIWGNWGSNNGYWSSPSSMEQWVEENPKFNLFLQYYGVKEEFIEICRNGLYCYNLYDKFKNKSEILNKMFVFLNNIKDTYKQTPLSCACTNDNLEMFKLLLENGAQESINVGENYLHKTPLDWAEYHKNKEMIELLKKYLDK